MIVSSSFAQEFAPIGAQWYYSEHYAFSGDIDFLKIESIKDTLIKGKTCMKLVKNTFLMCTDRTESEYVFMEDSIAYFYDTDFDDFQVLFDLKARKDSSWIIKSMDYDENVNTMIVSVDSVDFLEVNSVKLKRLHVTYTGINEGTTYTQYYSKILETIGDIDYLFNIYPIWAGACDANYSGGLRCYSDFNLGHYETGIADSCDYTYDYLWINLNKSKSFNVNIYPTLTTGQIKIRTTNDSPFIIRISNLSGQIVLDNYYFGDSVIDISQLQRGYYIVQIFDKTKIIGVRKIIKI